MVWSDSGEDKWRPARCSTRGRPANIPDNRSARPSGDPGSDMPATAGEAWDLRLLLCHVGESLDALREGL
ncbi:MAG: hypothetical protein ACM3ML_03290, partial [Micromonosporaceae bacterium]